MKSLESGLVRSLQLRIQNTVAKLKEGDKLRISRCVTEKVRPFGLKISAARRSCFIFIPKTTRRDAPKKPVLSAIHSQSSKSVASKFWEFHSTAKPNIRNSPRSSIYLFACWLIRIGQLPKALAPTAKKSSWEGLIWESIE